MSIKKCLKCNNEENVKVFEMNGREGGSRFDSMDFTIHLCECCIEEMNVNEEWFNNDINAIQDLYIFEYHNEDKIIDLINSLPIESQEKILNKPTPSVPYQMDSEEWINIFKDGYFNIMM